MFSLKLKTFIAWLMALQLQTNQNVNVFSICGNLNVVDVGQMLYLKFVVLPLKLLNHIGESDVVSQMNGIMQFSLNAAYQTILR